MTRVLDTKTFVVLGEGLAAGAGHFSLTADVQEWSFPALVAEKLGASFDQPLMEPPGVGNVGFQHQPAVVPDLLQTSVLEDFPREHADLGNLSVPGFSVADALELRPRAPMVWTDDPKQTLANLILGVPSLTAARGKPPTQLEYARARKPSLVLVALGYQELLEALVPGHIHGDHINGSPGADLASFEANYKKLLAGVTGGKTTTVVATVPNPLDTAYFSSLDTAAHILRTEVPFLKKQYGLKTGDLINLEGLVEIGYEFLARQVSGKLPEGSVISAADADKIAARVDGMNATIRKLAKARKALVFDLHGVLAEVAEDGLEVGDRTLTADYLGGFYLLNGVFPGRTGHAHIANELIGLLTAELKTRIGEVDVAEVMKDDGNTLSKIAAGGTFTDEYLEPRNAEDMPPLPPGDPSALNFFPPFDPTKFNIFPIQTTFPDSPFDFGGIKAINKCVPKVGVPAGGFSDPKIRKPLVLPEGLEQTLELNKEGSYFGDALRACDLPDEKPFINGLPTFGGGGNTFFGGLAMTDSHVAGKVRIRFTEPKDGVTHFEITHPGGLVGDDGVLAAPKFFKLPAQNNLVVDVPGIISSGDLELETGYVTNFRYNVIFINTQIYTLFNVNPGLPPGPLPQIFPGPPNSGSTWARFDQREDGKLDITMAANLWLPLGKEGSDGKPIRFPLPFGNPNLECASIVARGTSLHPHIHLTTKEPPGQDLGEDAPEIPVNTVKEFATFVHNNNFGDVFGLHIDELGGEGVGRSHLMGRLRFQFGPRCGDSVPFQVSFLPPGGLLSEDPVPLPYLPPGTARGMIGFNEQLKYPSGVVYNQTLLSSSMDPMNLPLGVVDLKTGRVRGEFLNRSFVVQALFVNLSAIEPCTPGDSFNYQGPARFETGPGGELVFSSNGEVFIPYPKGFKFPSPSKDGRPPYLVVRESRLDPFLRLQAMHGGLPPTGVLHSGSNGKKPAVIRNTSSIGEDFSYAFRVPADPAQADDAFFEYTNDKDEGTFKLTRLSWIRASNSPGSTAPDGEADTITFGGFGSWSKDRDLHQVSVHISTAEDQPYVGIQVDGGTTSNVNTKPEEIEDTIPLEAGE
ncbi:MAG: hypothetical protein GY719_36330 [bacterium]|nr:hypothetical protein [bacterium]